MPDIASNIRSIKKRVEAACERAKRDPNEVILLAATKDVPAELVEIAIQNGITKIGENRVQEADSKISKLKPKYPQVTWHMIGHLQRNKVKRALEIFDIIESVDSRRLAEEISQRAAESGKQIAVFIEVNVSGEQSKFGIPEAEAVEFVKYVSGLKNLKVEGLMTVPPLFGDPEKARPYFKKLKVLGEKTGVACLSMGMTDDFEVAVEEGSNMVRVGRGIFEIEHKH